MAATASELVDSREYSGSEVILHYSVRGTSSETEARSTLLAAAPPTFNGRFRETYPGIKPVWVDTVGGDGEWDCTVRYVMPAALDPTSSEIGTVTIEGDTGGGTQHITQSIANISKTAPPGKDAPDFKGAIGVTHDNIEGVDIIVPTFHLTVTKVFATGSLPNLGTLFGLTGKVNNANFTVTDTRSGLSITFAAGECLLEGVSFGTQRSDGGIAFSYRLAGSPNRANIAIGDITVPVKKGWEYLWGRYADGDDAQRVVKVPVAAYVEKVYELGDFAGLGI